MHVPKVVQRERQHHFHVEEIVDVPAEQHVEQVVHVPVVSPLAIPEKKLTSQAASYCRTPWFFSVHTLG